MNYMDLGIWVRKPPRLRSRAGSASLLGRAHSARVRACAHDRAVPPHGGQSRGGDRPSSPSRTRPATGGGPRTPSRTALPQTDGRALRGPRIDRNKHSEKIECGTAGHRSLGAIFSETRKLSGSLEVNPWFTECPININTAWYAPATEAGPFSTRLAGVKTRQACARALC